MDRLLGKEMMDDPGVDREDLASALRFIRVVNRRLGGTVAMLDHLRRWSRSWPPSGVITLLDIGTGSGDLPVAARRWAEGEGFDLRVVGVDLHPTTVALAREHVAGVEGVEVREGDALRLMDEYPPESFDYVHAGLFLHHLSEIRVLTMLRIMDRLARRGVIWNDQVRSRVAAGAIRLMTFGQPPIVRHDAHASVLAGFSRAEAIDLAERAGLDFLRYRWSVVSHRFTMAGERPGAW